MSIIPLDIARIYCDGYPAACPQSNTALIELKSRQFMRRVVHWSQRVITRPQGWRLDATNRDKVYCPVCVQAGAPV
jgi:hypothetical protein